MLFGILDFFKKCRNSATDIATVAQGVADTKRVRPTASDAQQVATGIVGVFHHRISGRNRLFPYGRTTANTIARAREMGL